MTSDNNHENASFDAEREKWREELRLREREIEIKEREQRNREEELKLKIAEARRSRWSSPLVLAIFAAAVAAFGNLFAAVLKRDEQQTLEATRSEASRILEVIKTNDPEKAATNLAFLLDTGLVDDPRRRKELQRYLDRRKAGQGPTLPTIPIPGIGPVVAQMFDGGAIAYSLKDGSWTWSYATGSKDRTIAEREALDGCGKRDCKVVVSFLDECGAAAAAGNGVVGGGRGETSEEATAKALEACKKAGGNDCVVQMSQCSGAPTRRMSK